VTNVLSNPAFDDATRREHLYRGDVVVYGANASTIALVEFTRDLVREAFGDRDPELAQYDMDVRDYAALLADLKPRFIHHPRCKELLPAILSERGCDLERTYFDVPRLRTSTSDDYLTTGIAFAFHPHRDTWYSAPLCQTNWWMPVFPVSADNVMAFHPQYTTRGIANGSARYDYAEWNRTSRKDAAKHIGTDTRDQPTPEEPVELDPQVRIVPEVGGMMVFSGNQLHSSVPNTSGRTRFSIDFRVVDIDDVAEGRGSVNLDCRCSGTTLRDFVRASDLSPMPEELAAAHDGVRRPVTI
jgi:hypothetical protein